MTAVFRCGLGSVACEDDVVAPRAEVLLQKLQVVFVVVDGENEIAIGADSRVGDGGHGSALMN